MGGGELGLTFPPQEHFVLTHHQDHTQSENRAAGLRFLGIKRLRGADSGVMGGPLRLLPALRCTPAGNDILVGDLG